MVDFYKIFPHLPIDLFKIKWQISHSNAPFKAGLSFLFVYNIYIPFIQ